jgi:hypothetical protein
MNGHESPSDFWKALATVALLFGALYVLALVVAAQVQTVVERLP